MKETAEQKEFRLLYVELENDKFKLLIDSLEGYIERFHTKRKKIAFLRYIQNTIFNEPSGSIFIHPDEIDYGNVYLSKFNNVSCPEPSEIMWLFTYRIEKAVWELNYGKKSKEVRYTFELKDEFANDQLVLEKLFKTLYDLDYIEDYEKENFIMIFSAKNIYQLKAKPINFNMRISSIAFLFNGLFRKIFTDIDESKIFGSELFIRKGKIISKSSIQNARSKIMTNDRYDQYKNEIDKIESHFLSIKV